jgi:hypothetical protein
METNGSRPRQVSLQDKVVIMCDKIWIGLVHAKPYNMKGEKLLEDKCVEHKCFGLFTNLFTIAKNNDEFAEKAKDFFEREGFKIEEIKNEEPFEDRLKYYDVDPRCHEAAEYVKETGETETTDWNLYGDED